MISLLKTILKLKNTGLDNPIQIMRDQNSGHQVQHHQTYSHNFGYNKPRQAQPDVFPWPLTADLKEEYQHHHVREQRHGEKHVSRRDPYFNYHYAESAEHQQNRDYEFDDDQDGHGERAEYSHEASDPQRIKRTETGRVSRREHCGHNKHILKLQSRKDFVLDYANWATLKGYKEQDGANTTLFATSSRSSKAAYRVDFSVTQVVFD